MPAERRRSAPSSPRGRAALFAALVALVVLAFALARSQRSEPDVVNTVELGRAVLPDGQAAIAFDLTRAEPRADVLVIENVGTETVATLRRAEPLGIGRHRFEWDLRRDDGVLVEPGDYAIRVVLTEQGRDIRPPGRIEVLAEGLDG